MPELVLRSLRLPAPHGFSLKAGGSASLAANVARIAAASGVGSDRIATVRQVHGQRVAWAGPDPETSPAEADALGTHTPGVAVGVLTADCVPILIADPRARRVAAVHSGWRGTELEVVRAGIRALEDRGSRPGDLWVAVGPSIRACCYEVSEDLAVRFEARFGPQAVARRDGTVRLDLIAALMASLRQAGVPPTQIDVLPQCTACDAELFFSHRRDRGVTGRHLNLVGCDF